MTIINQTPVTLWVRGKQIPCGDFDFFSERACDEVSIHSDIGSVRIVTEYSIRSFQNFGNIQASEQGRNKNIIVSYCESLR